jgi:cytochrome b subunit of formate dehydrogenase
VRRRAAAQAPAVTATDRRRRVAATGVVERYRRPARWFHAGVYVTVLILLITGWWLLAGQEGHPSPLAALARMPDTSLHKLAGWILAGLALAGVLLGARSVPSFVDESVRLRRSELGWFARWPAAVFTGRFGWHGGRFDPGQRFLNITLVLGLAVLVGSGAGLAIVHGGPTFVVLAKVHKWATYPVTGLVAGHILIASGMLPGYRGVWRSMHLGGRLRASVAQRLWPAWSRGGPAGGHHERKHSDRGPDSDPG